MARVGASSFMPIHKLLPTVAHDLSTTEGTVIPTDSTIEDVMTKDMGTTEGGRVVAIEDVEKPHPPA